MTKPALINKLKRLQGDFDYYKTQLGIPDLPDDLKRNYQYHFKMLENRIKVIKEKINQGDYDE